MGLKKFFKKIGKAARKLAPLASLIPGVGVIGSGLIGAAGAGLEGGRGTGRRMLGAGASGAAGGMGVQGARNLIGAGASALGIGGGQGGPAGQPISGLDPAQAQKILETGSMAGYPLSPQQRANLEATLAAAPGGGERGWLGSLIDKGYQAIGGTPQDLLQAGLTAAGGIGGMIGSGRSEKAMRESLSSQQEMARRMAEIAEQRYASSEPTRQAAIGEVQSRIAGGPRQTPSTARFADTLNPFRAAFGGMPGAAPEGAGASMKAGAKGVPPVSPLIAAAAPGGTFPGGPPQMVSQELPAGALPPPPGKKKKQGAGVGSLVQAASGALS